MKRYFVKEVSIATASNPNFAGAISVGYFGKGDKLVANADKEHPDRYWQDKPLIFENTSNMVLAEYGYSRKCDAIRNWTYNNPQNTEYWRSTVEIVEVEV